MKISEIVANFRDALKTAFPDASVSDSKTVATAIERVMAAGGKPVICLTPGARTPAAVAGSMALYGAVAQQSVLIYVGLQGGIAKRGETQLELADLVAEVENAALDAAGDWTEPRWEGSDIAQLPNAFPLDAWLIRVSVTTSQRESAEISNP